MEKIRIREEIAVFFLYSKTGGKRQAGADEKVRKPRSEIFSKKTDILQGKTEKLFHFFLNFCFLWY